MTKWLELLNDEMTTIPTIFLYLDTWRPLKVTSQDISNVSTLNNPFRGSSVKSFHISHCSKGFLLKVRGGGSEGD